MVKRSGKMEAEVRENKTRNVGVREGARLDAGQEGVGTCSKGRIRAIGTQAIDPGVMRLSMRN